MQYPESLPEPGKGDFRPAFMKCWQALSRSGAIPFVHTGEEGGSFNSSLAFEIKLNPECTVNETGEVSFVFWNEGHGPLTSPHDLRSGKGEIFTVLYETDATTETNGPTVVTGKVFSLKADGGLWARHEIMSPEIEWDDGQVFELQIDNESYDPTTKEYDDIPELVHVLTAISDGEFTFDNTRPLSSLMASEHSGPLLGEWERQN